MSDSAFPHMYLMRAPLKNPHRLVIAGNEKPGLWDALTMCCCYSDSSSFLFRRLHMRMLIVKALTGGGRVVAL